MNLNLSKIVFPAALFVAGAVVGLGLGWKLYRPKPPKVEAYAPEARQKDGSLILERKPQTLDQAKAVVKLPLIPKGGKVERLVKVTVQPSASPSLPAIPTPGSGVSSTAKPVCPPVTVDLALVRMPDHTQRVIASSPDGTVLSGSLDIPVVPDRPSPKPLLWAAGGLWNPADRTYGAYLRRAMGPLEVGLQAQQERLPIQVGGGTKVSGFVSLGIRW